MFYKTYPDETQWPRCPICGAETSDFYKSKVTGEVVGCYECVRYCDAWEETA